MHTELGRRLPESTYQTCLDYELSDRKIRFRSQVTLPISYRGVPIDRGYRVDLLVEERVIVEVKAVETLAGVVA